MLYNFFNSISAYFQRILTAKDVKALPERTEVVLEEDFKEQQIVEAVVDEISLAKRTLMTKLYALEQEIEVFKKDFSPQYTYYLEKINNMRESYNLSLEEIRTKMTFEIDPELNSKMHGDIINLEREIKRFIESEVKFDILSKRLQMLIVKLNILYNVSIKHPNENSKVTSQVLRALTTEKEIADEFKECDYILEDNQFKDRIVTLISYADYHIFKISLRNSSIVPAQMIEKLVLFAQFKDFDYITAFKAFVEDELSDLGELVNLIGDEEYGRVFEKDIVKLLKENAYATDIRKHLLDEIFWSKVFLLESSLLEFLRNRNDVEEDMIKVKLIGRMNIRIKESEVLTLPKTNAYLALTSVFSTTRDERILLLIKLFKSVSNEVTYKEIYFLLQLFDAIGVIKRTPNTLSKHMEKYLAKYPYDRETINKKKMYVLNSSDMKQYVMAFALDEEADKIIAALKNLSIDFQIKDDSIYINSFYFNGLEKAFSNNVQSQTSNQPTTTD